MATRAFSAQWKRAASTLVEVSAQLAASADSPPERLYHFTDCAGLIGIVENRTLWATLATALNDPSEITFGLRRAHELFELGRIEAKHLPLSGVGQLATQRATGSRAYVISFCQNLGLAGQWLHYGRSGSGAAVGFQSGRLVRPPYELFRVIYDGEQQEHVIRTVVQTIDGALADSLPSLPDADHRERLTKIATDVLADALWKVAPRLKHPAFAAEEEWRLIAYEPKEANQGSVALGPTYFRGAAGRVVPFKKLAFDPLPAFEIVLGASCPMRPDDLGILVLMEEKLGVRLTLSSSSVPVRS